MIEVDLSELQKEAIAEVNALVSGDTVKLRKEMLKFLKEGFYPDTFEYAAIAEFLNDFFICGHEKLNSD